MQKFAVVLLMCVAAATAGVPKLQIHKAAVPHVFKTQGVVTPIELCTVDGEDPVGTPVQLRVDGCEGAPPCDIPINTEINIEGDFIPNVSVNDALFELIAILGAAEIPVTEGQTGPLSATTQYTISQSIIVSDALVGQQPIVRLRMTSGSIKILCVQALMRVVERKPAVKAVAPPKVSSVQGVVTPIDRCLIDGSRPVGTPLQLRISVCEGAPPCDIPSNTDVEIEGDFIPNVSVNDARFELVALLGSAEIPVVDGQIGALNADTAYTVSSVIVVSNALVGQQPTIQLRLTGDQAEKLICVQAPMNIVRG